MNVLTIHSAYEACGYLRLYLPTIHNGFRTNRPSMRKPILSVEETGEMLRWADVVVFHRAEEEVYHKLALELKRNGKKIVMDNDDTFLLSDVGPQHPLAQFSPDGRIHKEVERRHKNVTEFVKIADLVTATTKTLADEYRQSNPNVLILPNCVDPDDWDKPLRNEGKRVRIGIVGSAAFEYDYIHVKDVIKKLSERDDVEFVLFGLGDLRHRALNPGVTKVFHQEYEFWDSIRKDHFPWVKIADYPQALNLTKLDIMMIPRIENYFNKCKSNVKYLEAAMCEIAVVAQSFPDGPYEEFEHNKNIIKITDNKDWLPEMERLIADKELQRTLGRNAKRYTLDNYNIYSQAHLWLDAYSTLYA